MPETGQPKVLFCDNHLLVAYKPAGMPTQTHAAGELSLEAWARRWVKEKYQKPGAVFLEPIHRLDKPVSGLVLFARTSKALSRLQEQQRKREIHKTYYARVEGKLPHKEGRLEHALLHGSHRAHVASGNAAGAKRAALSYRVVDPASMTIEITLETGRYHQIRAQLAAIGCPILGDVKYGSRRAYAPHAIALCCGKLELLHPVTREELVVWDSAYRATGQHHAS